jgi:hypothetical protein
LFNIVSEVQASAIRHEKKKRLTDQMGGNRTVPICRKKKSQEPPKKTLKVLICEFSEVAECRIKDKHSTN